MKCQIPYAHDSRGQNFVNFRAMCNWMWSKSATWWHWTNKGLKKLENHHKKVLATCCMTSDWWHCPEEMYVSKKHMVLKKYASAQSQGRPVKRNCHLSIPNRDTGKLVISTSTDYSYVNWKEVKTDRIIQNRFSKHQSIQVNIRAQFLYRNKFKELYVISLWTTSSESDIFPA